MEWKPIQADATPIPLLGEYLVSGQDVSLEQGGTVSQTFRLSRVTSTVLLGVFITTDYRAHSDEDLAFRLDAARRAFYSQGAYYGARCTNQR
eukprot:6245521-Pyramimonas_sp.AAC.1